MRLAISGVTDEDHELALQVEATNVERWRHPPTDKGYVIPSRMHRARKDRKSHLTLSIISGLPAELT